MNRKPFASAARRQAGLTLVESLIGMAVTAVSLGTVVPAFDEARQRRHLDGTAAQLETDIQYARSLAVAGNRSMRISFQADSAGSCYVVHTGSANACSCDAGGAAVCSAGEESLRSVRLPSDGAVQLRSNVRSILFDPTRGTSTPTGTLRLSARDDRAMHLVVNIMGRVRTCSPAAAVPGYPAC
jgi:type IV fimbrial biogenesis protein FimT